MTQYVFDACAIIAALTNEPGAEIVADVFRQPDTELVIHKINLLEVYYNVYRRLGQDAANHFVATIKKSQINIIPDISDAVLAEAGRLKVSYHISLGDSILLAETLIRNGILVSSDHHEFDTVETHEQIQILWIR